MEYPQEFDLPVTPEDYIEGLNNFLGGEWSPIVTSQICAVALAGKRLGHPAPRATTICYCPEIPTPVCYISTGYNELVSKFDNARDLLWERMKKEGESFDSAKWIAGRTKLDLPNTVVLHMVQKEFK